MRTIIRKFLSADRGRLQRSTERTWDYLSLFGGAALVALCVIALARVADASLYWGEELFRAYPWAFLVLTPLGFALITAQGVSELIKRIAVLRGIWVPEDRLHAAYTRPEQ